MSYQTLLKAAAVLGILASVLSETIPALAQPASPEAEPLSAEAPEHAESLPPILVEEGRVQNLVDVAETTSEGKVGKKELEARPILRTGELLETVPGLIVTQHSGTGKANQYFLRGFNLDHGTDFRTEVDGMPINMPTHAHGQGYSDLNFIIPELLTTSITRRESTTPRRETSLRPEPRTSSSIAVFPRGLRV